MTKRKLREAELADLIANRDSDDDEISLGLDDEDGEDVEEDNEGMGDDDDENEEEDGKEEEDEEEEAQPVKKQKSGASGSSITKKNGSSSELNKLKQSLNTLKASQKKAEDDKKFKNKQRVLIFGNTGITQRFRHLMKNMLEILPHSKKEVKYEARESLAPINEVSEMRSCNNCVFFEVRKSDTYMWVSRVPNGPSVKFYVSNMHTLGELKLLGNCLKGSRPLLVFDKNFDSEPHWRLIKELFTQVFGTPRGHPHSKPFIDHTFSFFLQDGRIWFRNYQLGEPATDKVTDPELVEIGPRFVLHPIRIFGGSFGGPTLYKNESFISPSQMKAAARMQKSGRYRERLFEKSSAIARRSNAIDVPTDELDEVFS